MGYARWLAVLAGMVAALACSGRPPAAQLSAPHVVAAKPVPSARVQEPDGGDERESPSMSAVLAGTDAELEERAGVDFRLPVAAVGERSAAPYLYDASGDQSGERLPLRSTSARVTISGVIAQVEVAQVFVNRGDKPIEAVYVFPASTRAAVHGMRMTIGSRVITAKIEKRAKARDDYEAAKQQGKRASLLEQERSNVFTMNVANIMPGDVIKAELSYSELIVPESGIYSFVYPTVVGPRNPLGGSPATGAWVANPHLQEGAKEPYAFDLRVQLQSPIPLKMVGSPSHPVKVTYPSLTDANIELAEAGGGNRDFVLQYGLRGDQIQAGTLTYDHGGEKFFLTMIEPPQRVAPREVVPREYVFVLDVSGSMNGFPLETGKRLMADLVGALKPNEYFNVVTFAGRSGVVSARSLPATEGNKEAALSSVQSLTGGGGTNLMDALRTSYALPRPAGESISRSIVVITDGYVAVEPVAFRFIRKHLGEANLFAFGIGTSVNRALIEGMARAGMGSPFVVLDPSEVPGKAAKLRQYVESPLLTNVRLSFEGVDVYDVIPQTLPDLMAERPLVVFGKYRGNGKGTIDLTGTSTAGPFKQQLSLAAMAPARQNRPLRSLWARSWLEELTDQNSVLGGSKSVAGAIEHLGLNYGLLSEFTSFVAIDSRVANSTGGVTTVRQPLPLPQGVSSSALSGGGKTLAFESSSIFLLKAIQFKAGAAIIEPASFLVLEEVVQLLRSRPELRLGLYGHSDRAEPSAQQLRLSKRRAEAVARYLVQKGIEASRLQVEGLGVQRPISSGATPEGRAMNRRVEIKILE